MKSIGHGSAVQSLQLAFIGNYTLQLNYTRSVHPSRHEFRFRSLYRVIYGLAGSKALLQFLEQSVAEKAINSRAQDKTPNTNHMQT